MHRIGDLRKYSRRWKIGDKARWLLEIRTDGDNATLDEIDEPLDRLQSRIRQLDFRELTLTKYKKTLLSNYVSEANFDIGMSEKHRMGASVFEFVSGNLDAIAEGLEDIVVERSEPHSFSLQQSSSLTELYELSCLDITKFANLAWPIISREAKSRKQLAEARRLKREAELALSNADRHQATTSKTLDEAERAAKGTRKAAGQVGIDEEASHFLLEAENHRANAFGWLIAAILGALLISSAAIYFYFWDKPLSTATIKMIDWNNFLPKLSALAILIFFEYTIISTYRSERHNQLTNLQRANALKTFGAMTSATNTEHITDAITLTAASAIYAPQDTGFSRRTTSQQMNAADIFSNLVNRNSD